MDQQTLIVIAVAVAVLVGVAAWFFVQQQRRARLRGKFGTEYDRALAEHGNPSRAEAELARREARVAQFQIRALTPDEGARFSEAWRRTQARFVDDPKGAVTEADRLVGEVMTARGYPVGEFEQRAADVSVEHPRVVSNYREAHAIAARHARGEATTEDLRQAFVHYRELFDDLFDVRRQERAAS